MVPRADVLPDYLKTGLRAVFCGTAAGPTSAARRHYYAGPGNLFWSYLYDSGLITLRLGPADDQRVLEFGLGLTDLVKSTSAGSDRGLSGYDIPGFVAKIKQYEPAWVAFHGKEAAKQVSRELRHSSWVAYGQQEWTIGDRPVFVLPSASAANQNPANLEGMRSRVDWFKEFAKLVAET